LEESQVNSTLEGAKMLNWIWSGVVVDKPATYSGKGVHILVTDRDGNVISRKMALIEGPYNPTELEATLETRLKELARDITVAECGYRAPADK
jgi:hypothetical protein